MQTLAHTFPASPGMRAAKSRGTRATARGLLAVYGFSQKFYTGILHCNAAPRSTILS